MPKNLCTTAVVLAAAGLGLVTFTVATPTDLRVEPSRAPVSPANGVASVIPSPISSMTIR